MQCLEQWLGSDGERCRGEGVADVGREQLRQGQGGCGQGLGFCSGCCGDPLEALDRGLL